MQREVSYVLYMMQRLFDKVYQTELLKLLRKDIRTIHNIYWFQTACTRINDENKIFISQKYEEV